MGKCGFRAIKKGAASTFNKSISVSGSEGPAGVATATVGPRGCQQRPWAWRGGSAEGRPAGRGVGRLGVTTGNALGNGGRRLHPSLHPTLQPPTPRGLGRGRPRSRQARDSESLGRSARAGALRESSALASHFFLVKCIINQLRTFPFHGHFLGKSWRPSKSAS